MCDNTIPITLVAAELHCGEHELRQKANGHIVRDDAGMTCLPRDVVRGMIAERDAELDRQRRQREQQREESQRHRAEADALHRARRARAAAQKPLVQQGLSALEVMLTDSNEFERRCDESPVAELLSGNMQYHPISDKEMT